CCSLCFFLMLRRPLGSSLFPYTTLFRSELLSDFKSMVDRTDPTTTRLCAHNGKEFDFPYICRRMLINGIALPALLNLAGRKPWEDRKSTRLNSSHVKISYAVFCLKKKKT